MQILDQLDERAGVQCRTKQTDRAPSNREPQDRHWLACPHARDSRDVVRRVRVVSGLGVTWSNQRQRLAA